jgi:hypothetical protein
MNMLTYVYVLELLKANYYFLFIHELHIESVLFPITTAGGQWK